MKFFSSIRIFFGETVTELAKCQWPTREELIKLTQVVILLILLVAAYCGSIDFVLGMITDRLFGR